VPVKPDPRRSDAFRRECVRNIPRAGSSDLNANRHELMALNNIDRIGESRASTDEFMTMTWCASLASAR